MRNDIKIIVIGKAGSGCSTVTHLIKELLRDNDFKVIFGESKDFRSEMEFDTTMERNVDQRRQAIKDSAIIIIEEKQAPRI